MEYTIERLKNCMPLTEGNYEEIDKDMIPILTELNEKGYKTRYCCQGHVNNGTYITYLVFDKKYVFSKPIPVYHIGANKNNKYTKISKSALFGDTYYWIGSRKGNDKDSESERKHLIKELSVWSKSIEPRKNNLVNKYYLWGINGNKSKAIGKMISEEERNRIKELKGYEKYDEILVITDGDKWKKEYKVI